MLSVPFDAPGVQQEIQSKEPRPGLVHLHVPGARRREPHLRHAFQPFVQRAARHDVAFDQVLSAGREEQHLRQIAVGRVVIAPSLVVPPSAKHVTGGPRPQMDAGEPFPRQRHPVELAAHETIQGPTCRILRMTSRSGVRPMVRIRIRAVQVGVLVVAAQARHVAPVVPPVGPARTAFLLPAEQADDLDGIVAQRAHRVVGRPLVAVTTPRGHAAGAPHV